MPGTLALVGGAEWRDGCDFDRDLLAAGGGDRGARDPDGGAPTSTLPASSRRPSAGSPSSVRRCAPCPCYTRPDALDAANVKPVADARCIYLAGGSPMHLRSVLKDSPVWDALVQAWEGGATVAGSSAGAMVLCDPMVDPRGGALTLGLGLIDQLAVIPHHDTLERGQGQAHAAHRTRRACRSSAIDERTALIRDAHGSWSVAGVGTATVFLDGHVVDLSALP